MTILLLSIYLSIGLLIAVAGEFAAYICRDKVEDGEFLATFLLWPFLLIAFALEARWQRR